MLQKASSCIIAFFSASDNINIDESCRDRDLKRCQVIATDKSNLLRSVEKIVVTAGKKNKKDDYKVFVTLILHPILVDTLKMKKC